MQYKGDGSKPLQFYRSTCTHYESIKELKRLAQAFRVKPVAYVQFDVWPIFTSRLLSAARKKLTAAMRRCPITSPRPHRSLNAALKA